MMKKVKIILLIASLTGYLKAQEPVRFTIRTSDDFGSPGGHVLLNPISYGDKGIIQVSSNELNSFCFQKFSKDLKLDKENTVNTKNRFNDKNRFERIIATKNKTYLLTREVRNEEHTEGISALEFFPDQLDFATKSISLFQSSDKVAINYGTYRYDLSQDKTKMMFSYRLVPKIKSDEISKATIGLYVFDEKLNRIWGSEYEMPYTERVMDILDYTVSNKEEIYMTIRVFENNEMEMTTKQGTPAFHYELLVFKKNAFVPQKFKMDVNANFPRESYVFEDGGGNMLISGLYSKKNDELVEGAYVLSLNGEELQEGKNAALIANLYPFPTDAILFCATERETEKFNKEKDKGVEKIYIRHIYSTTNGSVKIIAEVYKTKSNSIRNKENNVIDTYAGDIYIFSIAETKKLEWVKKIPKGQHRPDGDGRALSFNSLAINNDLHLFYLDTKKNDGLALNQRPAIYQGRREGYLRGVSIDENGTIVKYPINYKKIKSIDFFPYFFIPGRNDNLIFVERTARQNVLFSIEPQ